MNYLSRDYLEELADSVLLDCFGAEFMHEHKSINVDHLASHYLGLEVSYIRLSDDGKILGLTTYADVDLELERYDVRDTIKLKKDSVLIEKSLLEHDRNGCRRFTLSHEVAHQIIYRIEAPDDKATYQSRFANETVYSCRDLKSADDWREWQANTLAAALLMPRNLVDFWLFRFNNSKPLIRYGAWFNCHDRQVLSNMCSLLGVSRSALVIRLLQLGFIRQRPLREYNDPLDIYPDDSEVDYNEA